MIVYRVSHRQTGRVYIGITTHSTLTQRWKQHRQERLTGSSPLNRAMREDGTRSFTIEPVARAKNLAALRVLEGAWIHRHKATDPAFGYNRRGGSPWRRFVRVDGDRVEMVSDFRLRRAREAAAEVRELTPIKLIRQWRMTTVRPTDTPCV